MNYSAWSISAYTNSWQKHVMETGKMHFHKMSIIYIDDEIANYNAVSGAIRNSKFLAILT